MNRVYNGVLIAFIILLGHIEKVHSQDFYLTKDGYAYFENNPKTLGVDFGIGIPEEWTIQDSELPGVIAEMYHNQDIKLIISIEAGETFISRKQARVAVAGINLLSKRPDQVGKAITSAALVETYAIFALLISVLLVLLG